MDEVIKQWHKLFQGYALSQRYLNGEDFSESILAALKERAEVWRKRLIHLTPLILKAPSLLIFFKRSDPVII